MALLRSALSESLQQGALGLSFDVSDLHSDGNNERVPARAAPTEELIDLCAVVGEHPGTTLEGIFVGGDNGFDEQEADMVARLSATANRPLNWNLLVVDAKDPDRRWRQLTASRRAREIGGRVVALTMPTIVPMNMSFLNYCALNLMPGWAAVLNLPVDGADGASSRIRRRSSGCRPGPTATRPACSGGWPTSAATSSATPTARRTRDSRAGWCVTSPPSAAPIPSPRSSTSSSNDRLATVLWPSAPDDDDAHWALRAEIWNDPDVMLGGSDAGAHLDRMVGASYPTQLLADCLRGRGLLSVEQAVKAMTDDPARLFGLTGRGRLEPGFFADIVLFDPETVGATARRTRQRPAVRCGAADGRIHRRRPGARQRGDHRHRWRRHRRAARGGAAIRA